MKQTILLLCILAVLTSYGQQTRQNTRKIFQVKLIDSQANMHAGYLSSVSDTSLSIVAGAVTFGNTILNKSGTSYDFQSISEVTVKRKNSTTRGLLIGTIVGSTLGTIIGAITYKKIDCSDSFFCWDFGVGFNMEIGAGLGAVSGAIIGTVIGALAHKTFIIGGNRESFKKFQVDVLDRAYGSQ